MADHPLNDLRRFFFGGDEQATLLTFFNAGVDATDLLALVAGASGAYTQTYATADKTHANPTSAALTNSSGGTADGTVEAMPAVQATPTGLMAAERTAIINNFAELTTQINALRVDLLDVKQLANAVIDDLQSIGMLD